MLKDLCFEVVFTSGIKIASEMSEEIIEYIKNKYRSNLQKYKKEKEHFSGNIRIA